MTRPTFAPVWLALLAALALTGPALGVDTSSGLLWRIERGGATLGYLFGTIHSEDPRVTVLPPAVAEAFDQADTLAIEAVMDPAAILEVTQAMLLPPDQELADRVGPVLAERAVATAERHGLPQEIARRSKPWALVMSLSAPVPRTGLFLDMLLQQRALQAGKTLEGLEVIAEQFAPFEGLTPADERLLLARTLQRYDQYGHFFEQLLQGYLDRDLAALQRLSNQQLGDAAVEHQLMEALLTGRNHRMARRADALLSRPGGVTFIAVGALHLPGAEGLVNLLADAGYQLTMEY